MPRQAQVTPVRLKILSLLLEYKQLLTTDIGQAVRPGQPLQFVQRDLAALRGLEMVKSFSARPQSGNSELYWQLRQRGAAQLSVSLGNHYYRKPGLDQLRFRGWKLALTRQVETTVGWKLVKPISYSSSHPLALPTRQYELLEYGLGLIEYRRMLETEKREGGRNHQRHLEYEARLYRLGLSNRVNDYVAYTNPGPQFRAVILVLTPPHVTGRFWQTRLALYKTVAPRIPTVGVFSSQSELNLYREELAQGRVESVLVEAVSDYLGQVGPFALL